MSSETDPLRPNYASAPEISGHGFSAPNRANAVEINYQDTSSVTGGENVSYGTIDRSELEEYKRRGSHIIQHDGGEEGGYYAGGGQGEERDPRENNVARNARISQIIALFTFIVAGMFVFMLATSLGGEGDDEWRPLPVPNRPPSPAMTIHERAENILKETPLFDGHNDLAIFIRGAYQNRINNPDFKTKFSKTGMEAHVDIPRLRSGLVGGAFWSSFAPCPINASYSFTDATYAPAVSITLGQIDLLARLQSQYPDVFSPASTSLSDALAAFHSKNRTLLSPISIEGLHQLPPTAPLSALRLYFSLGVKAATLTWNCHNVAADAALISDYNPETGEMDTIVAPNYRNGLTPLGRTIIHEMNRLGMLVDLSHTSYWTQLSVLSNSTSRAPVIYSHSSVFSICPHPRNVHDDILDLLKENGGVTMINFTPDFVSCTAPDDPMELPHFYEGNSTIDQVVRHIKYVGERIGYDHVGLGSDFDGTAFLPDKLEDVAAYPRLVRHLLRANVSDSDVSKVVGGNLLRVWRAADEVAQKMRADGVEPAEDAIEKFAGLVVSP